MSDLKGWAVIDEDGKLIMETIAATQDEALDKWLSYIGVFVDEDDDEASAECKTKKWRIYEALRGAAYLVPVGVSMR